MNLFSLLRSSSAEIILSKRTVTLFYACIAAAVIFHAFVSVRQFIVAYVNLHQFDLPASGFIATTLFFMLPFWFTGALLIRAILQRMRLAQWARRAFTFAWYETSLRPAEVGLIVDSEFNHKEVAATLVDLHLRQAIYLGIEEGGRLSIQPRPFDPKKLTYYENYLLGLLLPISGSAPLHLRDPELVAVFEEAHLVLIEQLTATGKLPKEVLPGASLRSVFRILYGISAFVGLGSLAVYVQDPDIVNSIAYPRYPVVPGQLWVLGGVLVFCMLVVLSGFWPRFARHGKSHYQRTWMEAAGLLLFMRVVYQDRFSYQNFRHQDPSTIRTFGPYAVAFGLIQPSPQNLSRILGSASSSEV